MNLQKFTEKAQQAILATPELAREYGHASVEPEHLLVTLLEQEDGVVPSVLRKLGVDPVALAGEIRDKLDKQPKMSGGGAEPHLSPRLRVVVDAATADAKQMQDDYVSTEHLLLGLTSERGRSASAEALKQQNITRDRILEALTSVRGSQRVTDPNPENKYQALEKYGRDLTELAKKGKLDPVIGRDEEVRRVIQVLSRRTKNNPVLIGEPGVGKTAVVEGLAQVDPEAARRIHATDPQRIQRALEVYRASGRPISEWQRMQASDRLPVNVLKLVLAPNDRAALHSRIEQRFDAMLAADFLDEVRTLRAMPALQAHPAPLDLPAIRAVGYRQAWEFLDGQGDAIAFRERAIAATRQLAKRQWTWLRGERDALWFEPGTDDRRLASTVSAFLDQARAPR